MSFIEQPIFLFLIAVCLVLSLIIPERGSLRIILPVFFALLLTVEIVCYYLKQQDVNNLVVYNWWFPVEYVVYSYWIVAYVNSRIFRNIYSYLIPLYALIVLLIYFLQGDMTKFNSYAFQLGFLLLFPALLIKLYEYMNAQVIENPVRVPQFWLITGLLFSYVFSLCQFSIHNYLNSINPDFLNALEVVNIILTDILYLCIIIYFGMKWKSKSSLI